MRFLITYIKKKLLTKKMQSIILVCAVGVSAALFIIANAMTQMIKDAYLSDLKNKYIGAEVYVQSTENEILEDSIWHDNKDIAYGVGTLEYSTICYPGNGDESAYINIEGILETDLSEFEKYNFIQIQDNSFSGEIVYIGKKMAEKYAIALGDELPIRFGQKVCNFYVAGFYDIDGLTNTIDSSFLSFGVIVPRETVSDILGIDFNTLYLKCENPENSHIIAEQLKAKYPELLINEVSDDMINQEVKGIFTTFNFLAVLVIITCLYIMVTSYKVVLKKRIHEMGIMRSLGATRNYVRRLLILEAASLGGLGGIIGSILGYLLLYIVTKLSLINGMKIQFHINMDYIFEAIVITTLMAAFGAFIAGFKLLKTNVTELLLDKQEEKIERNKLRYVGFTLLLVSIVLPLLTKNSGKELAASANTFSIVLCLVGTIMAIPLFIDILRMCFKKLLAIVNNSNLFLCMNNLQNNKNTINSISIVAISVASVLLISIVGMGILSSTADFFTNDVDFDIWLGINRATDETLDQLTEFENIEKVYASREEIDVRTVCNEKTYTIERIQGIKSESILEFVHFDVDEKLLSKINNGRYIILTEMLKDQFQAEVGDKVFLSLNGTDCEYEVIGFYDTVFDGGNTALIADKYLVEDTANDTYRMFYVKAISEDRINETVQLIKEEFYQNKPSINLNTSMAEEHINSQKQMMSIQSVFILFCIIISIVGVLNNILLNYENRQKYYAIYRSLGMNKISLVKNLICESFLIGLFGGIIGCCMFRTMIFIIPYLFKAVAAPKIHLNMTIYTAIIFIGISSIVTILVSIMPAIKTTKGNILISLKKE